MGIGGIGRTPIGATGFAAAAGIIGLGEATPGIAGIGRIPAGGVAAGIWPDGRATAPGMVENTNESFGSVHRLGRFIVA